jgi:hypothetical protein
MPEHPPSIVSAALPTVSALVVKASGTDSFQVALPSSIRSSPAGGEHVATSTPTPSGRAIAKKPSLGRHTQRRGDTL